MIRDVVGFFETFLKVKVSLKDIEVEFVFPIQSGVFELCFSNKALKKTIEKSNKSVLAFFNRELIMDTHGQLKKNS
uniref:DUF4911 domain-containing protein n=1 Tax=Strongyloides papillosus TaxID=174720 RepID=A0A0N5C888_STREA